MTSLQGRRLTRPYNDRMVAGVCAGLAAYLRVDPTVVRVAAVLAAVFSLGAAVVGYVAAWILMPEA